MRQELHAVMIRFVSSMKALIDKGGLPFTSEVIQAEMGQFYDFLAIARTPIHRDYHTDEIDELPEPEFPTRISNTISRLCEVHALFYGREKVGQEDIDFGHRVILDNIPTRRWQILKPMSNEWNTTSIIGKEAIMSTEATKRVLDELVSLKLVERRTREEKLEGTDRRSDSYRISDKWLEVIEELRGVIRCDGTIDSENETKNTSSNEEEYISNTNSPPQFPIIIPGEETSSKIGPHPRKDQATPNEKHKLTVVRFLVDRPDYGYKKDEVVAFPGCLLPGQQICKQISCGACPAALSDIDPPPCGAECSYRNAVGIASASVW